MLNSSETQFFSFPLCCPFPASEKKGEKQLFIYEMTILYISARTVQFIVTRHLLLLQSQFWRKEEGVIEICQCIFRKEEIYTEIHPVLFCYKNNACRISSSILETRASLLLNDQSEWWPRRGRKSSPFSPPPRSSPFFLYKNTYCAILRRRRLRTPPASGTALMQENIPGDTANNAACLIYQTPAAAAAHGPPQKKPYNR